MRRALLNWLQKPTVITSLLIIVGTVGVAKGLEYITQSTVKPLNRYGVIFETGGRDILFGDELVQSGPCNIITTNGKPVIWLCTPHIVLPFGPAGTPLPSEEESLPTPKDPNQRAGS